MSWEYELAKSIKKTASRESRNSIPDTSIYEGTIVATNPLKISICDGAYFFEDDEIIQTKGFSKADKNVGDAVIVESVDNLDRILVIDGSSDSGGEGYNLPVASETTLGGVKVGSNLKISNGVLSVDTVSVVEEDNTKPITSGAVHMELGNIEALLSNI